MATILAVDDRALNREYLTTLLGYMGHVVLEAADGAEALALARATPLDLVITDIVMPTMDGVQFANAMHADPATQRVPIIFYSATYRVHDARTMAQSCGVTTVVSKPAEPQDILNAVNSILGTPPPSQQAAEPRPAKLPPPEAPRESLSVYLDDLAALRLQMQQAFQRGMDLVGEGGDLQQASDHLIRELRDVQRLALRLTALVELSLDLTSEQDVAGLVDLFCRAAHDILSTRYAAVALLEPDGKLNQFAVRGMDAETAQSVRRALDPVSGLFGDILAEGRPRRLNDLHGDPGSIGLPPAHPPVDAILIVPVRTAQRGYGWLYTANKLNNTEFDDDDARFGATLATQLALTYENLRLYDDVRQSEQRFRQLAENIREVFFLGSKDVADLLYVSPAYEQVWGRSLDSLRADPMAWAEATHPDDRARVQQAFEQRNRSGHYDLEYRIVRPDNEIRWIRARGFPVHDEAGRFYRVAGICEDITDQKTQQMRIARLSRISAVLSGINSAIVRTHEKQALFDEACRIAVDKGAFAVTWVAEIDPDTRCGKVVAASGGTKAYLDAIHLTTLPEGPYCHRPASVAARENRTFVCNDISAETALDELRTILLDQGLHALAYFPIRVDNRVVAVLAFVANEVDYFDDEELKLLSELAGDVSFGLQYIDRERQVAYLAYYDALTGLPNRRLFDDRLTQMVNNTRDVHRLAVIALDIRRFNELNDAWGRQVGDEVLKVTASRLSHAVAEPCTVARIGADRFAVAVARLPLNADATSILNERILGAFKLPVVVEGRDIHVQLRAGIAFYPDDGQNAESLYRNAEAALKQVKGSRDIYRYYSPELNATVAIKLTLEGELRTALETDQLRMYYQPKVDMRRGQIIGAEALIRWQHPSLGLVSPAAFIPLAEQCGLIVPMGEWVIRQVCGQQARWRDAHVPVVPVAANLSAAQLRSPQLMQVLGHALDEHRLEPAWLELELTETIVMEQPEEATRLLQAIRERGIGLALDDFGTGYSSLAYLKRFPFSWVKIDRAFVANITENPDDAAIATTIIAMAHRLNLRVIAEGVETEGQFRYLRDHHCDELQGYYFSPPVPAEEFETQLRTAKRLPRDLLAPHDDSHTLLVVEDDEGVQASLKRMLRGEGYRLLIAANGLEALEALALNRIQVIVCDQRMPGMSGSEFLSKAKDLYPDTIRIILTGYTDLESVIDAVNRGAVYKFLTKPWQDEQLREHIRDAFRRYRPSE